MNYVRINMTKHFFNYVGFISNIMKIQRAIPMAMYYSTVTIDAFAKELIYRRQQKEINLSQASTQYFIDSNNKTDITKMNKDDIDNKITELLSKNKDKEIENLISECENYRKCISFIILKRLFNHYSSNGKPDMIMFLQKYCSMCDPILYKRNGEFLHYLAKAQCMKGNSEIGLSLLKNCYSKYENLRSGYRIMFRDLIQDSVLNRSEASLVIFKKNVLEFSEMFSDHYPLLCYWYICWASTWFSDQMLANELLESSEVLLEIVKDKAGAFSMMTLRDYNEDAVVRLLQIFLKYNMMSEYAAVLQVFFNYKLKNRDIRSCTEIIRNCEVLGVTLPSDQQGRYIRMLIERNADGKQPVTKLPSKNFKLKF